jgi:leader peptidase (prepilin peptidase) / N-methyltransferase
MENILLALYVFIMGLLFGSFFNVCIYRIPAGESIVNPPSHCPNCGSRLKVRDLMPVLSYLFLMGRCRHCREDISPRYAIIELFTGVVFLALFLVHGLSFEFIKYVVLASFMIVIGMIDYDTTDVYFSTTITGIIAGIILIAVGYYLGFGIKTYILGGLLGGGVITLIILITKAMGWGDVEICLLGGLFLGFGNTVVMLFFSFIIGGVIGVLLIVTKKKSRKDYIPFGPAIALAAIFVMLFGEKILNWYMFLL